MLQLEVYWNAIVRTIVQMELQMGLALQNQIACAFHPLRKWWIERQAPERWSVLSVVCRPMKVDSCRYKTQKLTNIFHLQTINVSYAYTNAIHTTYTTHINYVACALLYVFRIVAYTLQTWYKNLYNLLREI